MVVEDFHCAQGTIGKIFSEFGRMSGLRLNLPKTVLIPLWPSSPARVRGMLQDEYPSWASVEVDYAARYLGFVMGPQAQNPLRDKACAKY